MLHNIILPKILDQSFTKLRILLIPLSIAFSNPKILGFLFCKKNSLTWRMNCEKSNFRKSLHEWNGHLENFSRAQVLANPRQYLLLRTEFCRISRWVPLLKLPGSLIFKKKLLFSNSLIIHDVVSQPERSIRVRWMTLKLNDTPVENHQCFFTFSSLNCS